MVSVLDPAELEIDDVFMLDADFAIERPKRVYRQGLSLLHIGDSTINSHAKVGEDWDVSKIEVKKEKEEVASEEKNIRTRDHADDDATTTHTAKTTSTIGRFFSKSKGPKDLEAQGKHHSPYAPNQGGRETNADVHSDAHVEERPLGIMGTVKEADVKPVDPNNSNVYRTANAEGTTVDDIPDPHVHGKAARERFGSVSSSDEEDEDEHARHKNIDPSIGRDPRKIGSQDDKQSADGASKKKASKDVSQHTFFVRNAQRKVKFVAKNEVSYHFFCEPLSSTM